MSSIGGEMPVAFGEDEYILERYRRRSRVALGLLLVGAVAIIARLWFLQVIRGGYYLRLSEQNRIRIIVDEAPRGLILDREGRVIVGNQPSYDVLLDTGNRLARASLRNMARLADLPESSLLALGSRQRGRVVRVLRDVDFGVLALLEEHRVQLPGLEVRVRPKRRFELPSLACHVIGYLGEATRAEVRRFAGRLRPGDRVGRSGVEKAFDRYLRGIDGRRLVETDATGRVIRTLRRAGRPVPGDNLVLTIDLQLQASLEKLFDARRGAVVVMDPGTGEVLAMVSRPSFDLSVFGRQVQQDEWEQLRDDPDSPLTNRCLVGQYAPGSTFKVFVALAALGTGAVRSETEFTCTGKVRLGDKDFYCWKREGHGPIRLRDAIVHSCNIYFYKTGLATGMGPIARLASQLGLGSPTGISFLSEAPGFVPSGEQLKALWPGDVATMAIGQGRILVTPIQMAVAFSALVNGGEVLTPRIVEAIRSPDGRTLKRFARQVRRHVVIPREHLDLVLDALRGVVNEGGTGWRARVKGILVAGKTGTAQVVQRVGEEEVPLDQIPYNRRPHSWFVGFAPAERPRIVFVVVVEHGGPGGGAAASYAREVVDCAAKAGLLGPPPGARRAAPGRLAARMSRPVSRPLKTNKDCPGLLEGELAAR